MNVYMRIPTSQMMNTYYIYVLWRKQISERETKNMQQHLSFHHILLSLEAYFEFVPILQIFPLTTKVFKGVFFLHIFDTMAYKHCIIVYGQYFNQNVGKKHSLKSLDFDYKMIKKMYEKSVYEMYH